MAEEDWEAPKNWREYLSELRRSFGTILYTVRLADSPDTRPWFWAKYGWLLIQIIAGTAGSLLMTFVYKGVDRKDMSWVNFGVVVLGLLLYSKSYIGYRAWRAHENLFGRAFRNIKTRVLDDFNAKSPGQHKHVKSLTYESVQKGINRAGELYDERMRELFECLVEFLLIFVGLSLIAHWVALLFAGVIALHSLVTLYVNYRLLSATADIEREFSRFERYYAQLIRLFPRIYVSGKREFERERMRERWWRTARRDCDAFVAHAKRISIQDLLIITTYLVVIRQSAAGVITGSWGNIALLYPIISWSGQILGLLGRIRGTERQIYKCIASISVMRETLALPPDVTDAPGAVDLVANGPLSLEFRDISYAYPGNKETVSNVSFVVKPGEKVALIGPTGAGKSTLEYLPLCFMRPSSGTVLINGRDIREYTVRSVLRAIGYIPQKPLIFDGTVRENLLYALSPEERERWSDEELLGLMRDLSIDFGIREESKNPLDIVVGRDGVELSGGQAQRLAIGAVVITQPHLLVVDEATSALDSSTETELLEGLRKWINGSGMLVIAHRLSTVRDADQIVVLNQGTVEAIGSSFGELSVTSATFRRLVSGQDHLLQ